jgi:hypothetical protein
MGIGKDLEGIDRRILYVLPCCSPENCEEPKSELPVTRQRFEPGTFWHSHIPHIPSSNLARGPSILTQEVTRGFSESFQWNAMKYLKTAQHLRFIIHSHPTIPHSMLSNCSSKYGIVK